MRLDEYINLVVRYSNEGIDGMELEYLYARANESRDPEIKLFFKEMASEGEFVTRYSFADESRSDTKLDGKNICLNFSGVSKELYCNTQGFFSVAGYDATEKTTVKSLGIKFTDSTALASVKKRAGAWFTIGQGLDAEATIEMIHNRPADTTLVERLIPQVFNQVTLPESAMVISEALLSIFSLSDSIDAETKKLYGQLVKSELANASKRARQFATHYGRLMINNAVFFQPGSEDVENTKPILCEHLPEETGDAIRKIKAEITLCRNVIKNAGLWMPSKSGSDIVAEWDNSYILSITPVALDSSAIADGNDGRSKWREFISKWTSTDTSEIKEPDVVYFRWLIQRANDNMISAVSDAMIASLYNQYETGTGTIFDHFWNEDSTIGTFAGFLGGQFLTASESGSISFFGNFLLVWLPAAAAGATVESAIRAFFKASERRPILPI
jgi:hypothetical protein